MFFPGDPQCSFGSGIWEEAARDERLTVPTATAVEQY